MWCHCVSTSHHATLLPAIATCSTPKQLSLPLPSQQEPLQQCIRANAASMRAAQVTRASGHAASSSSRCVRVCAAASTAVLPARQRQQQRAVLRHLGGCNLSQFSSFQGAKMMLPECWMPAGMRLRMGGSSTGVRRKPVSMSFLGVGAPEAILVAVVALVVFGPKGLAEAAKSVGKTLKAFQPTIREVVSVSQDIKGTLEKELGLDEIRDAARPAPRMPQQPSASMDAAQPSGSAMASSSTSMDVDEDIEAKRAMSAQMAWGGASPKQASSQQAAPQGGKDLGGLTMEELEAELNRRKTAASGSSTSSSKAEQPPPTA